jgi:heme/copper-type cytochrome/quinol oxidase subunit 2
MLNLTTAREFSLMTCAVLLLLAFSAVLWTHWQHRRSEQSTFHASTLTEMGWSITPVLMVLTLVSVAFKDYWLV